jgi:hypothetical protein
LLHPRSKKTTGGKFMRFLMRMAVVLVLVFAVSGVMANAATTAKKAPAKKTAKKKAVKKVAKKKVVKRVVVGESDVLSGANLWGRPGLIFADTAEVGEVGKIQGTANFLFESVPLPFTNTMMLPFGANAVVAKNLDIFLGGAYSAINYNSDLGWPAATAFTINGGLKYAVKGEDSSSPDFSIGEDLSIPTNGGIVVATTRGCMTYTVDSKLLLNADAGIAITNTPYFVGSAGLAYAFSPNFTGIAEIGGNQLGYSNSILSAGFRGGKNTFLFQGTFGLNMANGQFVGGGGIVIASE